ncbi:MAG: hypothetical protein ABW215_06925 [Kibdelosporangium sp.]
MVDAAPAGGINLIDTADRDSRASPRRRPSPSWTTACAGRVPTMSIYQIHQWNPTTSDEETLSALTDLRRGIETQVP